jgi:ATP phosphoribosyltransferase
LENVKMTYKEIAIGAKRILVPKGEDGERCIEAFQIYTGIEVPSFKGEKLKADSQGRDFYKVKGADVPLLLARGMADIGVAGTDVCFEFAEQKAIRYQRIGEMMCSFMLLAEADRADEVRTKLRDKDKESRQILTIPTSRPNMLDKLAAWQGLPLASLNLPVTSSIEAMAGLTGLGVVADLVESGETARQNGLVGIERLCFVYPEIIAGVER